MTYNHSDSERLSYSGAKILLEPGGPAKYRQVMDGPRVQKLEYDLGHAVHRKVLGKGETLALLDFPNYMTKAAKEAKAEAYAARLVPVLPSQLAEIDAAAEAVLKHPIARRIYESGEAEVALSWDAPDGTPMRGMVDWIDRPRFVLNDLKTATDASPRAFARACALFHYEMQVATYDEATGGDFDWTWTVVELRPPYLCAVYEPDLEMVEAGRTNLKAARRIWNECRASGVWPGLPEDVQVIGLPEWALPEVEFVI